MNLVSFERNGYFLLIPFNNNNKKKKKEEAMSIEKPSKANPSMPPPIPLGQTAIPITRIQRIVKTDKEVNKIAADAAFLITKATVGYILYAF